MADANDSPSPPHAAPTVMLLGSGEFSRELAIALQRLGAQVIAVERYADAPAHGVADQSLVVNMTDADELSAAIRRLQPRLRGDRLRRGLRSTPSMRWPPAPTTSSSELVPSARDRPAHRRPGRPAPAGRRRAGPAHRAVLVRRIGRRAQAMADHAGYPLLVQPVAGDGDRGVGGPRARRRRAGLAACGRGAGAHSGCWPKPWSRSTSTSPCSRCAATARTGR